MRTKNAGKVRFWTFPDHTRPKGKRKNRLPYMIAEKGQRASDKKAYNMKRSCLKKASSFCSICKPYAKKRKTWKNYLQNCKQYQETPSLCKRIVAT
jgi:hypothetical protein